MLLEPDELAGPVVKDITDKNFGVIIAFWLPGFLLLWGLSYSSPEIALWLNRSSGSDGPTVGNFLYTTLASLAAGLLISAVRWLLIDHFLELCGRWIDRLKRPSLDLSQLAQKDVLAAFGGAVENHYRYYQYYSNTLVAVTIGFLAYANSDKGVWLSKLTVIVAGIGITLLLAAGDSLGKYYNAAYQILNQSSGGGAHDERLGTPQESGSDEERGGSEEGSSEKGPTEESSGHEASTQKKMAKKTAASVKRAPPAKAASQATITLKQIAAELAVSHDLPKKVAESLMGDLVAVATRHLKKGDKIRLTGLGSLQVRSRAARMGRNPATGEAVQIKASRKVAFRPAKELKETM